jgi:hypothetical protein
MICKTFIVYVSFNCKEHKSINHPTVKELLMSM